MKTYIIMQHLIEYLLSKSKPNTETKYFLDDYYIVSPISASGYKELQNKYGNEEIESNMSLTFFVLTAVEILDCEHKEEFTIYEIPKNQYKDLKHVKSALKLDTIYIPKLKHIKLKDIK